MNRNNTSRRWAMCLATMARKRVAKEGNDLNAETRVFDEFLFSQVAVWIDKAAARTNVPPETLAKRIASRLI
jgi:hypothetical protein